MAIWSIRTGWIPVTPEPRTDESRHPDTQLNYANEFNLNIKGWLLNEPNYRPGLMAGYQEKPL
ncbi:omptin family outer membrane protease [Escherichia coli]